MTEFEKELMMEKKSLPLVEKCLATCGYRIHSLYGMQGQRIDDLVMRNRLLASFGTDQFDNALKQTRELAINKYLDERLGADIAVCHCNRPNLPILTQCRASTYRNFIDRGRSSHAALVSERELECSAAQVFFHYYLGPNDEFLTWVAFWLDPARKALDAGILDTHRCKNSRDPGKAFYLLRYEMLLRLNLVIGADLSGFVVHGQPRIRRITDLERQFDLSKEASSKQICRYCHRLIKDHALVVGCNIKGLHQDCLNSFWTVK